MFVILYHFASGINQMLRTSILKTRFNGFFYVILVVPTLIYGTESFSNQEFKSKNYGFVCWQAIINLPIYVNNMLLKSITIFYTEILIWKVKLWSYLHECKSSNITYLLFRFSTSFKKYNLNLMTFIYLVKFIDVQRIKHN